MDCKQVEPEISAYLDGELSDSQQQAIEEHLKSCSSCQEMLNTFRNLQAGIQTWKKGYQDLTAHPDYATKIMSRIKSARPTVSRWRKFFSLSKETWWIEVTAAACALLVAAWFVFGPSPYEEYYIPEPGSQYSVKPAGSDEWKTVSPGEKPQIKKGDTIKTTTNQSAEIKLPDKILVKLKEHTEITLIGSVRVYSHKEETCEAIDLNQGEIYVETQDSELRTPSYEPRIKVETPAGEIINRGTKFNVKVEQTDVGAIHELPKKEEDMKGITGALAVLVTVSVMQGQVLFTNPYGEQIVNAGETASASKDSKPTLLAQGIEIEKPVDSGAKRSPDEYRDRQKPKSEISNLESKIKKLIQQLGDDDYQTREAATKALEEIGLPAELYLQEALQNSDPEVRMRVKGLLHRIEANNLNIPEIKRKLETIKHDFVLDESSTLLDHTDFLPQNYGIPINYELEARELALKRRSLTLKGLPLKIGLKHLLEQYGLTYTFRDKGIWIMKLGTVTKRLRVKKLASVSKFDKKAYRLLERKLDFPFKDAVSLVEIVDFIHKTILSLHFIIDGKEVDSQEKVAYFGKGILLKDALSDILGSKNLGYMIKDGVVVITTQEKILKPMLKKIKDIIVGKVELKENLQVKYKIDRWKQGKNDEILIFNGRGDAYFAMLDESSGTSKPKEYYRCQLPKKDLIRLLKIFIDNNFLNLKIGQIKTEKDLPFSSISLRLDANEYNLLFPLTLDLTISENQEDARKLQTIEKCLNEVIKQVKEGVRKKRSGIPTKVGKPLDTKIETSLVVPSKTKIGKILAASQTRNIVMISAGSDAGVTIGTEFGVYRGDKFIGKIRVANVDKEFSSARTIPESMKDQVQENDDVCQPKNVGKEQEKTPDKKIEELIKQLGDEDWSIRDTATQKLIEIGKPTIPYLKKASESKDAEVRFRAKLVLSEITRIEPAEFIVIKITKTGEICCQLGDKEIKRFDTLQNELEAFAGKQLDPNDPRVSNQCVLIHPDRNTPYVYVLEVVKACARAKIWRIEMGVFGEIVLPAFLPKDKGGPGVAMESEIRIVVDYDEVNKEPNITIKGKRYTKWDEILKALEQIKKEGKDEPIIIEGRKNVAFQHIINFLDLCRKAGLSSIRFAARAK